MARRDVELVIRAKNDASKAIEQVSAVLKDLAAAQVDLASGADKTSSTLAQLVGAVTSVEKAYRTIDDAAGEAQRAFQRQVASLGEAKAQYAALQNQIDKAGQAIVSLTLKLRENPSDQLAAQLREAQNAYKLLNAEATKTAASIVRQQGDLGKASEAYRTIENSAIAAQLAVRDFGSEGERSALRAQAATQAQVEQYRELARAAREAQAADNAQQAFNRQVAPGLVNDTKSARDSASILEVAAARDEENRALREQVRLANEEVAARRAQSAINRAVAPSLEIEAKSARDSAAILEVAAARDAENRALQDQVRLAREEVAARQSQTDINRLVAPGLVNAAPSARDSAAILEAAAAREAETEQLRQQVALTAKLEASQLRINQLVAPGLTNIPKSAEDSASILAVVAAREAEATAIREQINLAREEVAARQAQANVNRLVAAGLERSTKSARDSAQVFVDTATAAEQAAAEEQALASAAAALRAKVDPLSAVQDRLNKELEEAARLFKAGKITAQEYAQAQNVLRDRAYATSDALKKVGAAINGELRGERQRVSLFGLKPYELTNLGYQINDVFTQLASGTSVTQTFAQQGGQILQLFPRLGSAVVRALPLLAAFGAAFTPIIIGLNRVNETASTTRQFLAQLAASADGSRYTAENLVAATRAVEGFGASTQDASAAIRTFVQAGINPAALVRFGKAAQDVADITGKKLPDAAKEIATGFTGGYEAIKKLDEAFNFLSASQDEEIRRLYQQGKASEAAAKAFDLFAKKQADAAALAKGPWTNAWRALGQAYNAFLEYLSKTSVVTATAKALEALANGVELLFKRLSGNRPVDDLTNELNRLNSEIKDTAELMKLTGDPDELFKKKLADLEKRAASVTGEIDKLNKSLVGTGQAGQPGANTGANANPAAAAPSITVDDSEERLKKQSRYLDEVQRKLEEELKTVGKIKQSEEERIDLARDLAYQKALIAGESEDTAQRAGAFAELTERLKLGKEEVAQTKKLNEELDKVVKKKLENADAINRLYGLTEQARIAEERRQAVSKAVSEEEQKYLDNRLKLTDDRRRAIEAAAAAEFDAQNRGRNFIEERERIEKNINSLIELRSQLLEQQQAANAQGNTTQAYQLQTQIEEVNTKLKEGVTAALAWWAAIKNNPEAMAALKLTALEIDAIRAKLETTAAASTNVTNKFLQTGQQINEAFANMGASAFDKFAKAVAEGENAATALRNAFLGFASDFLRMIAQMIIKQALFNAVSGGGGAGGGGGLGGFISGAIGMLFHEGGIVGSGGSARAINPAWFANAIRYHTGGVAGLKPNEVPSILQKGEEVLTQDDPRHVANGGASQPLNVRVVNTIDAGDFVSKGLGTTVGEKAILNFIRANAGSVRAALG